jgi:hypothetical protein
MPQILLCYSGMIPDSFGKTRDFAYPSNVEGRTPECEHTSGNILARHTCTLTSGLPPNCEIMPRKELFVHIANKCHNIAVMATPGHSFCAGPAPCGP